MKSSVWLRIVIANAPSSGFSPDQYRQAGYTGPVPILSEEEAAAGRKAYFSAIGQSEATPGPTNERPGGFNLRFRWAYELATHQKTLDHAERILGPDIVLWAMVFWYKEPHNSKYIPWHQDATYWPMEPRINLTAWVALGPTFRENGCLRLIPGSHSQWLDEQHQPLDRESAFGHGLSADQVDESSALDLEMAPGEVVFFNEATLHGSDANSSDMPRLAYALRFTTPEVKFDPDGWKEISNYYLGTMLVRGEDRFHYNDSLKAEPPRT